MTLENFYLCEESPGLCHTLKNTHTLPLPQSGAYMGMCSVKGNLQRFDVISFCSSKMEPLLLAVKQGFFCKQFFPVEDVKNSFSSISSFGKKAEFSANVQGFIFLFYLPMVFSYLFPVANFMERSSYDRTNLWNFSLPQTQYLCCVLLFIATSCVVIKRCVLHECKC